ncbi:MAG TPA: LysR substrate-binding domain-containing protein [Povalibacter sp.]|jgi:DNA-binding transcriptional LysR family regulator
MAGRRPLQLDRLVLFTAVAEAGGFTAAADRLDSSKTLLSQQINRLEAELGVALFNRTTRRVVLTEAGQRLFNDCKPLLEQLRGSVERLTEQRTQPAGTLRITAPADYAANVLGMLLGKFAERHPQLQVDLVVSGEVLDLLSERIDLAIRIGWLRDSSLRATRLAEFEQYLVASSAYLSRAGLPRQPADLARHRWIALSLLRSPLSWRFTHTNGEQRSVHMQEAARVNAPEALLGLLRGGTGISAMADFAVDADLRDGRLQRILPQWHLPSGGIYAVYPATRQLPLKVRVFLDFLREHLRRD